jgi:hypothetical protein
LAPLGPAVGMARTVYAMEAPVGPAVEAPR